MSRRALAGLALAASGAVGAADAKPPGVAVFTLASIPVRAAGAAAVYELDRRDRQAAAFGADLPSDPEAALAESRRRLASPAGRALRAELEAAGQGNALAARLGVDRLPAVVVDGRYAVYGVRDVRRALELVAAWRADNETDSVDSGPGSTRSSPLPDTGTPPARSLPGVRTP